MKSKYNFDAETVNFRINKSINAKLLNSICFTSEVHSLLISNKYYYTHNNTLLKR